MIFTAFIVKHFICDYPLQGPYQYLNKGTFGHPGGLLHCLITISGTALILAAFQVPVKFWLPVFLVEGIVHYLMDWGKIQINRRFGWTPTTTDNFWILLGVDQMVHYLTYVWIVWYITGRIV